MSFEHAFVEQAEYLESEIFSSWHASHPDEDAILRKLCHGGAKLISGLRGCGKTTLLRIIAGLEKPDYGKVIKKGIDITLLSAEKQNCGIVFQNYALFPNLNVEENIAFG